jgi:hypothetical protein
MIEMILTIIISFLLGICLGCDIEMGVAIYKDIKGTKEIDMDVYEKEMIVSAICLVVALILRLIYNFLC